MTTIPSEPQKEEGIGTAVDDGGAAFPSGTGQFYGMSLRDYFAAKAMGHHINGSTWSDLHDGADELAGMAYAIADAMLRARRSTQ